AVVQVISSAGSMLALPVSSSANMIDVNGIRITAASIAPMPSNGHSSGYGPGKISASRPPNPAPSASNGASVPPEVPELRYTIQISALTIMKVTIAPPTPTTSAPIAGHHIQWIGSLR